MQAVRHWARVEGVFAAPEGAAVLSGYQKLLARGIFKPNDSVVLFNTGTGYKYLDVMEGSSHAEKKRARQRVPSGGLLGHTDLRHLSPGAFTPEILGPMTERLYYRDSFLYEFDGKVVEILGPPRTSLERHCSGSDGVLSDQRGQVHDVGTLSTAAGDEDQR